MTAQTKTTWRKVKLGELAKNFDSKRVPISSMQRAKMRGRYPYYGAAEIVDTINDYIYDGLYLLIAEDGTVTADGNRPMLQLVNGKFWVNNHAHVLQSNNDLETKYLFYALRNTPITPYITGAVQLKLTQENLNKIGIPYPENGNIREKITSILSAFDDKIELNNKISRTLEQIAQAIFKEWFIKNTKFKSQKLGELIKIISGYPFSSKLYVNNNEAFGVVTIKNVQDGNFITSCDSFIKDENIPKNMSQECILNNGDILLSLTGNVGRVCFVYGRKYLLNQRVAKLKPKSEKDHAFCYFLFRQTLIQNQLINMAKGSAQPNLSPVETGEIELAIPSREVLDNFSELASPIYERLIKNAVENQKLAALRDLLLPKLMSGEIKI